VFHRREGQWRAYIQQLKDDAQKSHDEADAMRQEVAHAEKSQEFLRAGMKKKATEMLSRICHKLTAMSDGGQIQHVVGWWRHHFELEFKDKLTGELKYANQTKGLKRMGAILVQFVRAVELSTVMRWHATMAQSKASELALHHANQTMHNELAR